MKALTIIQPWASLIVDGLKTWEMRGWWTSYRGPLAIHAGRGKLTHHEMRGNEEALRTWVAGTIGEKGRMAAAYFLRTDLPKGRIIGMADLADCININKLARSEILKNGLSDPDDGFAWVLKNVRSFDGPEINGALGLWEFDP